MGRSARAINWKDMAEVSYRAARLFRALSNPKSYALCRLLLEEGEAEVGAMAEVLHRRVSAISKILRDLRELNVVRYQKVHRSTWYALKHSEEIRALLDIAEKYITHSEEGLEHEM